MKKTMLLSVAAVISLGITGCSSKKVSMKALVPADVPVLTSKRNVAVSEFKDDKVNLSAKVESQLASVTLDKKNFFTVTNRAQLSKVLEEQKLQSSDLSSGKNAAKIGKLVGAQAIVGGVVVSSFQDGSYVEQREKCVATNDKGKCVQTKTYNVTCPTASANVSASLNIVDVETAQTIHASSITKDYNADGCKVSILGGFATTDGQITSGGQAVNSLADAVAKDFVIKLAPRYIRYSVELMEKVKSVDITKEQKQAFENALAYLENGRMEKAEEELDKLYSAIGEKAFEIAYDLGLVKQSLGKYDDALSLFETADKNTPEPNKLLDQALLDIKDSIKKQKEAEEQMKKGA